MEQTTRSSTSHPISALSPRDHIAIVGAGFSGTLQAINLLRHDGPRVTLIERRKRFARGVAYSTPNSAHLLNVRAANMSALPDDPDHFLRWLGQGSSSHPHMFASRTRYGDYLTALLKQTMEAIPGKLVLRQGDAAGIDVTDRDVTIRFDDGEHLRASAAILALGNLPPHDPLGLGETTLPPDLYISDPWQAPFPSGLSASDTAFIIGTGLTMIDVVLSLEATGFAGRIVAISRRGLLPHPHGDPHMPRSSLSERPAVQGAQLIRFVRQRARSKGWRAAIDELRPYTQSMWGSASFIEQQRFMRHLRPWWDIHRHRLAPEVFAQIKALQGSGRLEILAGKLASFAIEDGGIKLGWRPRGSSDMQDLHGRCLINCTGPQGDLLRTREPLLRDLLAGGHIRPDRHRLGIDINQQGQTINACGIANPRLLALGPMTRGAFWEIIAVPDIRIQAWSMARRLANAHWVEGEGL